MNEKNTTLKQRSSFSGKIGFVLAAAGSAVGLGNIWRFPYLAAQYGGGIFLLVYIALALTFGFTLMVAEIAIGRKTGLSPLGAFQKLNKKFSWLGYLATMIPVIILPYYSVIGGWVMKYAFGFISGEGNSMAADGYFGEFISLAAEPLIWFTAFIALTSLIVFFEVDKGIEKVSKTMMPALVILMVFIVIYNLCTIEGSWEGVLYYITPDFSKFSIMTVVAAMGQLFYSMSLAMGIMITFGSYMKKDISIEKSAHQVEIFDSGIAFLSGLLIVPSVFAFSGGDESALGQGPGLMFVTLPKVFMNIPGGSFIGAVFFIMVFFAALTSAISLMETIVSVIIDKTRLGRRWACLIVLLFSLALGIPSSLGYSVWSGIELLGLQFLDFFDFISNSVMMPILALFTSIMVGFVIKPQSLIDELNVGGKFKSKTMFTVVIRYFAPVCILTILISSILNVFGVISI